MFYGYHHDQGHQTHRHQILYNTVITESAFHVLDEFFIFQISLSHNYERGKLAGGIL